MITKGVESISTGSDTFHSKFVRGVDRAAVFDSGSYFIALSPLVLGQQAFARCLIAIAMFVPKPNNYHKR